MLLCKISCQRVQVLRTTSVSTNHLKNFEWLSCCVWNVELRRQFRRSYFYFQLITQVAVQHEKLWPTGILVRRPSCLELTARTSATNYFNWPFQALTQDVFIRADIVFRALKTSVYLFSGLYKFTYLLTFVSDIAIFVLKRDVKLQLTYLLTLA